MSTRTLFKRVQDILPLTEFFVAKFAARLNKTIDSDEIVEILKAHDWPGNIRELQSFIERAMLYSPGSVLRLPLALKQTVKQSSESAAPTLAEADREHILETLNEANWLLPDGRAANKGASGGRCETPLCFEIGRIRPSSHRYTQ